MKRLIISILAVIAGLWLLTKIFWLGMAFIIGGVIGLLTSIVIDVERIKMFWYKTGADVVLLQTYKKPGTVRQHETSSRPGFLGGKRYSLVGEVGGTEFSVNVSKKVYADIKDGDSVKLSALEYRVLELGKLKGTLKNRVFVGIEKVG